MRKEVDKAERVARVGGSLLPHRVSPNLTRAFAWCFNIYFKFMKTEGELIQTHIYVICGVLEGAI